MNRNSDRDLAWLLAIGLALRIIWALMVPVEPVSDSWAYANFARNIVEHGVYGGQPDQPSAYWAVGPAAITAATFLIFGTESFVGVVLLNLLAGALIILLIYRIGEIWYDQRTATIAALIAALWPNLIFFTSILSSEIWFIALTLGGLWFHERRDGRAWLNLLLAGVIWGLACYVRPVILLLPVALALVALPDGWRAILRAGIRAALLVGLIVLTVSPWTYRNARTFGSPVLVSTNFGPNLWMGNNPDTTGGYMPLPERVGEMDEIERAETLKSEAKDYIRSEPVAFVARTLRKVAQLHERETIGVVWNGDFLTQTIGQPGLLGLKLIATGYWFAVLGLAVFAVALRFAQSPARALFHPAIAGWAYFTMLHAITVVEDRYHMPSAPFIALLAAASANYLLQRRNLPYASRKERRTT
ncbi:glycosyltransferase family 39 protein [Paracoccus sp. MBLB3053]|uniref:Glycosyltransferase family 39 protein n=1 Tax=Paracoccus aurantius TaxID=3073814 RepID=A0ABU2HUB1_9RHOB|nr:glycosyltransferase family 39 protein [Paracoccus sp. MBLB3053]MDS9468641.1 glycosyltransferase family 39 protein [Paracoccus sp. MBLB3053]